MKKIIVFLFLFTTCLTFAIPDFDNLKWGFTASAIRGFYPNLEVSFSTNTDVTKYNYYPEDSNLEKITFFLYENKLYKVVSTFNPNLVKPEDVKTLFNKYSDEWGTPSRSSIDETYPDFNIRGNEQTWIVGTTYISFIGQDYLDKDNILTKSKLMVEYGLIDPIKRGDTTSLNHLILTD